MKIYVVEDDDNIREMVTYALETSGFETKGFADGSEVIFAIEKEIPKLILLDIMLPGSDGISILKNLKQSNRYRNIPIIMLTAKGREIDRIKGLDLGADDYITKPFSVMEAIARVKAVLRRYQNNIEPKNEIIVGNIELNNKKHEVLVSNEEVILTYKEYELLYYLMLNKGIVLSRDKILEKVWGYDYGGVSRTVDMHIKSLRQKLGDSGAYIITIRNVGYKIGE